jgi:hypothetical protein
MTPLVDEVEWLIEAVIREARFFDRQRMIEEIERHTSITRREESGHVTVRFRIQVLGMGLLGPGRDLDKLVRDAVAPKGGAVLGIARRMGGGKRLGVAYVVLE